MTKEKHMDRRLKTHFYKYTKRKTHRDTKKEKT